MPSIKLSLLAVATALVSAVTADYVIDPSSVSMSIRKSWCASEISSCPLICEQTTSSPTRVNTCDPATLTYGCICGNGLQPNISEYSLTIPYFVCQEWGNQCVTACGSDNSCSSDCREDNPCGAQNPTLANATSSTASSASTATGSSTATASDTIYTGLGGNSGNSGSSDSSSSSDSTSAAGRSAGLGLGLGLTMGGLAAGFFMAL